jgi:hypothetical protein
MGTLNMDYVCHTPDHTNRRTLLKAVGLSGISWLTPLAQLLARESEAKDMADPAKSVILLWLDGGASQLDTFDPHPGTKIGGETRAINTALKGVQLAEGLEQTAYRMSPHRSTTHACSNASRIFRSSTASLPVVGDRTWNKTGPFTRRRYSERSR